MVSLLASIGIGGTVGVILGIMEDPVANTVLSFSFKKLRGMARGEHLSKEEKEWIKEYNNRECVVNGIDYTDQMRAINLTSFR
mgnify:FL=1|jgi:hypothetical protein